MLSLLLLLHSFRFCLLLFHPPPLIPSALLHLYFTAPIGGCQCVRVRNVSEYWVMDQHAHKSLSHSPSLPPFIHLVDPFKRAPIELNSKATAHTNRRTASVFYFILFGSSFRVALHFPIFKMRKRDAIVAWRSHLSPSSLLSFPHFLIYYFHFLLIETI